MSEQQQPDYRLHVQKIGKNKFIIKNTTAELFTGNQAELDDILMEMTNKITYKRFKFRIETMGLTWDQRWIGMLRQEYKTCMDPKPKKTDEDIPLDPTIKLEDVLKKMPTFRQKEFETIACVVVSDKTISCPPWIMVISPPSTGKTHMFDLFDNSNISMMADDFTENALSPGRPNVDAAAVKSMLDQANDHNLILQDMSSVFGMKPDKINMFISSLTAAYGGKYRKFSPGDGNLEHEGHVTVIMGMTPQLYKKHRKYVQQIGNRFLSMRFERPEDLGFRNVPLISKEDLQDMIAKFIWFRWQTTKNVTVPLDIADKVYDFSHKLVLLRGIKWANSWSDVEGEARIMNELLELCRARAVLHDRVAVIMEDFDFFKPLTYGSVQYPTNLYKIYKGEGRTNENNQFTRSILLNAIKFKMTTLLKTETKQNAVGKDYLVEYYSFNQEWTEFCKPILESVINDYHDEDEVDKEVIDPMINKRTEWEKKKDHAKVVCKNFHTEEFTYDDFESVILNGNFLQFTKDEIKQILNEFVKFKIVERPHPEANAYFYIEREAKDKKKVVPKKTEKKTKGVMDYTEEGIEDE